MPHLFYTQTLFWVQFFDLQLALNCIFETVAVMSRCCKLGKPPSDTLLRPGIAVRGEKLAEYTVRYYNDLEVCVQNVLAYRNKNCILRVAKRQVQKKIDAATFQ